MNKHISFFLGLGLLLAGSLALVANLMSGVGLGLWQLWPLAITSVGLVLLVLPWLVRGRRALGALFIPALPILATSAILLLASLTRHWNVWGWLWPLEVLGLAAGFLLAALYTRLPALAVPAIIIGMNGLVFQFCAITGLWQLWAIAWVVEPLSIGLALLLLSLKTRSTSLVLVGFLMCALAGLGVAGGLVALLSGWWAIKLALPFSLIVGGCGVLAWALLGRPTPVCVAR